MSTSKDQKTYLQKYISGPSIDKKKKKKKEKKVIKGKGFKIIDDDLDLTKLRALETDELDIYGEGEDAPQVAGIIDDRPEELKKLEQFKTTTKWRVINQDDGFNSNIKIEEIKQSVKESEKENEIIFGKMYSDSEDEKEGESKKQNNDSDPSPPRKSQKQNNDSDESPPRKNSARKQNGGDVSPPRKKTSKKQGDDRQPMREPSRKYDSDESPPRKQSSKEKDSMNESRKNRMDRQTRKESPKNYDSDPSPPRKREHSPRKGTKAETKRDRAKHSRWGDFEFEKNEVEMINQEQINKSKSEQSSGSSKRHDADVRKKGNDRNNVSDRDRNRTDKSQKRKNSSDSDLSPPRRVTKNTERDTRHRQNSDSDLSPPRKHRSERDRNKRSSVSPPPTSKRMAKTLEGKMAGLQDARQLRKENESFRQREDEVFNKMGDEVSGRNAMAVSRKGKRDTSEDRNKQREKAERQKELDDKYKKWGRGLKQIEDQQERMQDFMHEASKPLARHKGDKDLEDRLKDVERAGDPMLKYIKEKKREAGDLPPERPSYKGSYLPNRFNIPPGYRWDGVDRSNGYEKKYFDNQSKRKAQEEEAYKWSTEDL